MNNLQDHFLQPICQELSEKLEYAFEQRNCPGMIDRAWAHDLGTRVIKDILIFIHVRYHHKTTDKVHSHHAL
jgi:hypothetical protein